MLSYTEWFSGIGALSESLRELCKKAMGEKADETQIKQIVAIDINRIANKVYKHNFGIEPLAITIENITLDKIQTFPLDLWLLSPPCQPFIANGPCRDVEDTRCSALISVIEILQKIPTPPKFLLLENVKGFGQSQARETLVEALLHRGYTYLEYIVSPSDKYLGIPYKRMRYFLLAWRDKENAPNNALESIHHSPLYDLPVSPYHSYIPRCLHEFLDDPDDILPDLYLTEKLLLSRPGYIHDVIPIGFCKESPYCNSYSPTSLVDQTSYRINYSKDLGYIASTFTKSYTSRHILGTGSMLQTVSLPPEQQQNFVSSLLSPEALLKMRPRYLTVSEILKLHGFSKNFTFPEDVSIKHQYRLLGNSLSVDVVQVLLAQLLHSILPSLS